MPLNAFRLHLQAWGPVLLLRTQSANRVRQGQGRNAVLQGCGFAAFLKGLRGWPYVRVLLLLLRAQRWFPATTHQGRRRSCHRGRRP